jgi:hypothetical protein
MSGPGVTSGALRVGFTRALLAPVVPLVALALVLLIGLDRGAVVLVFLALLIVAGGAAITVLGPSVTVDAGRLTVGEGERKGRGPGGSVDLTRLSRARSVGYLGGLVSGRGLALFRTQLLLEDADGGQAMFGAWGWTPKAPLQAALRTAVSEGHAQMDPMTFCRLGFTSVQGARISPLRRFL